MTLLEILRRELRAWPRFVQAFAQDGDGEMASAYRQDYRRLPAEVPGKHRWVGGWQSAHNPDNDRIFWYLPVADDASTAIVTREMWEAQP